MLPSHDTSQVDSDGNLLLLAGPKSSTFFTLDGIAFTVKGTVPHSLVLATPWKNFGTCEPRRPPLSC